MLPVQELANNPITVGVTTPGSPVGDSFLRQQELLDASVSFFSKYNVTHWFTLTYGSRTGYEQRMHHFSDWIDALEWMQRRPLGWVRADEMKRYSGCGYPAIPEHHHGFLVGADHLSPRHAENIWRSVAGDALVEKYERDGGAIPYTLKLAFHRIGDWDLGGRKGFREL